MISGAASPGQQVWIGSRARSTSSPSQHDFLAGRAGHAPSAPCRAPACSSGHLSHTSRSPWAAPAPSGARAAGRSRAARPYPRRRPSPRRRAAACRTDCRAPASSCPAGCSNSSAGPPARSTRSQISVISSRGETSARDALQLARRLELRDEVPQVGVVHLSACAHQALAQQLRRNRAAAGRGRAPGRALGAGQADEQRGRAEPAESAERRAADRRSRARQHRQQSCASASSDGRSRRAARGTPSDARPEAHVARRAARRSRADRPGRSRAGRRASDEQADAPSRACACRARRRRAPRRRRASGSVSRSRRRCDARGRSAYRVRLRTAQLAGARRSNSASGLSGVAGIRHHVGSHDAGEDGRARSSCCAGTPGSSPRACGRGSGAVVAPSAPAATASPAKYGQRKPSADARPREQTPA